jgi:hypothetical protein
LVGPDQFVLRGAGVTPGVTPSRRRNPKVAQNSKDDPRITIGQSFLAMDDRTKAGSLSRRAIFHPVSRPLQPGIRFIRIPLSEVPQRLLRFAWRCRQHYGLTLFRMSLRAGRTLPLRRRLIVDGDPIFEDHSSPHTLFGSSSTARLAC